MKRSTPEVITDLKDAGIAYRCHVDLSEYSWFKSGGSAELLISPNSVDQVADAVRILARAELPYKVIGETSNLLFLDGKSYSCLLNTKDVASIQHDENSEFIIAETGAMLPELSRFALHKSIAGFAGLEGIPGTIGGAVFMNAGAFNYSIDQVLDRVDVIMPDGSLETHAATSLGLHHRDSVFRQGINRGIIVRAFFHAKPGDHRQIYSQMELFHAKRHKYLEYMYPNLGSLFVGSVYRALGERDYLYKIVSALYIGLNYKYKIFRRESPINRKWLNDFTVRRFNIRFSKQPFSDKTLNMLVNNGHHTDDHLDYIRQIENLTGNKLSIENEIVQPF